MDRLRILTLFGFLAAVNGAQNTSSSTYLILVSKVVRPGIPTTVSVTNLRDSPVLVISEIIHGKSSIQTQSSIKAGSTETQVLPAIPENELSYWFPYELHVRGYVRGTLVFSNSTILHYSPKSMSILLQTDKPNYKPGQAVKIRAVLLTFDGKPYDTQIDIVIMDPRQNRVHQWLSVSTVLGTASREFQLSENPPLGKWEIMASVNEVTQVQVFNVHHYVLPKFEVEVEAPEVLYYKDHLTYTVTAQYLYGKPVMGMLTVTYVHGFHGVEAHYEDQKMIDGTVDLSFDVPALYRQKRSDDYLYPHYGRSETGDYIDISTQVTEYLTGVTQNSTVRISIAMYAYNLEFQHYPTTIKPSLSFSLQLKLSTYDNHPLTLDDQNRQVSVTISQQTFSPMVWDNPANLQPRSQNSSKSAHDRFPASTFPYPSGNMPVERWQLYVPADGVLSISTQLTEDVATLTIEAQYEDAHKTLQLYREYSSPSKSYIQLQTTSNFQMGEPLTITVETNFPFSQFHYAVTARGQLLTAGTFNSSSFTLSPDMPWFPLASVVVYCINPDGEIINDALDVSFTQVLRNNVSLSFGTHRAEPAEAAFLTVSVSEPGSLVGILVVDKGSLDSERTNDITERKVIEEMSKFNTEVSQPLSDWMSMKDPYSVFMTSGMTVLTDAWLNPVYTYPPELREGEQMITIEEEEQQQRRNFPETWLWLDINMNQSTTTVLPLTVPDTMTSWVATAFVISENLGMGISAPVELEVFKDFFLSLNLPAYIIRGELLLLEVSLFNYMDWDLEVLVMVQESSMFEFVSPSGGNSSMDSMIRVSVWSQNGTTVLFPIRVTELGQVPIIVKAISLYASDSVYQTILVKPEGIEQSFSQTLFLEFPLNKMTLSREMEFNFPVNVVPGSQRAMVTAVGDLLGPSINGLDALIQMPYGCGEQNMINFAPNVYILQYLSITGRVNEEIRSKALTYMTQGYERELSYQRIDGSFSAFGDSDSSGSTWLSAFVLRCFLQARAFMYIDEAVLMRTAFWLRAQQGPNGAFQEPGRVIHTELQGGLDGSVSLTAYVLMALLEDVEYNHTFSGQVSAAINYLTLKLREGISSNYSLCLVTYALSLAKSPHAITALNELMNRAQIHDDVPTWSSRDSSLSDSWQPRSTDIEMAAYTLLSFYKQGTVEHGFSLLKWLSQQRNHLGGYGSTQDTVIALQALSAYATLSSVEQIDLTITVTDPRDEVATFTINQSNYLLYQCQEIEAEEELHIRVSAVGKGFAVFQLTTFYNIEAKGLSRRRRDDHTHEAFDLDIYVMDYNMYNIFIFICFRLSEDQELNQTGMAILDVGLLTGFSLAQNGILINSLVRKVETSPGKVILYLDSVTKIEECIEVPTTMEFKVTRVQDAVVAIYDYYEPRRKTVRTYTSEARQDLSVCQICGNDCSQCENNEVTVFDSVLSSHQGNYLVQCLAFVLLITLALCF
ncbi:CD109 antigen isoform X2 [Pygocentrus nattereri]|uniref:CD109 antigen isoform X2 n=1 Tax=Pygocentrus nattereri TaxID=42514 RepID=UPI0008143847|nr:CD109 antigen isoform X2 [Pygocentrus nattereri]